MATERRRSCPREHLQPGQQGNHAKQLCMIASDPKTVRPVPPISTKHLLKTLSGCIHENIRQLCCHPAVQSSRSFQGHHKCPQPLRRGRSGILGTPGAKAALMQAQLMATLGQLGRETRLHIPPRRKMPSAAPRLPSVPRRTALFAQRRDSPRTPRDFSSAILLPLPRTALVRCPEHLVTLQPFFFNPADTFSQHIADCQQMSCNRWHRGASEAFACAESRQAAPSHAGTPGALPIPAR